MKKFNILFAITALIFASLACQAVMGGGNGVEEMDNLSPADNTDNFSTSPPDESSDDFDFSFGGDAEFPMPEDAANVVNMAGTVNYQTSLSLDEVMAFYRDAYRKQGLAERELLTTVTGGVFNLVFDGHESGQAIVIQGVDLGDGSMNVNIRLEDV
ncbi:MAG: hypothetical protein QY332_08645 [Anaerolineales bacterium]|nr:MAG: hypothetical protein QY332_08645 [Anaerolineales bacterium]